MRNSVSVFLLLIAVSLTANAQQVVFDAPLAQEDQLVQIKKQFIADLDRAKEAAQKRILSRIEDIDRACELTDSQKKKLNVGSKGAVKSFIATTKKTMLEQAKQMGYDFDPDEPIEEQPKPENEEGDEAQLWEMQVNAAFMSGGMFGGSNPNDVESQDSWTKMVEKTLTDEQKEKWHAWTEARLAYQREVAVSHFIAKVDRRLLLSEEQRKKLTELISEQHGESLREKMVQTDQNQFNMGFFVFNQWQNGQGEAEDDETDKLLGEFLTESQLAIWKANFANELSGGANGNLGVFLAPAVGAAVDIEIEESLPVEEDDNDDEDNR